MAESSFFQNRLLVTKYLTKKVTVMKTIVTILVSSFLILSCGHETSSLSSESTPEERLSYSEQYPHWPAKGTYQATLRDDDTSAETTINFVISYDETRQFASLKWRNHEEIKAGGPYTLFHDQARQSALYVKEGKMLIYKTNPPKREILMVEIAIDEQGNFTTGEGSYEYNGEPTKKYQVINITRKADAESSAVSLQ